jgi:hypothetical protein
MKKIGLWEKLELANINPIEARASRKRHISIKKPEKNANTENSKLIEILREIEEIRDWRGLPMRQSEFMAENPELAKKIYSELSWLVLPAEYSSLFAFLVSLLDEKNPIEIIRNSCGADENQKKIEFSLNDSEAWGIKSLIRKTIAEGIKDYEKSKGVKPSD